ncbi:MAG: autoinducer binding domain-containing protein, partial [Xanthomonadales bacterium]|nr:autoinducer binding domain-containing protein [Xanthomonadales bacterium]
MNPRALRPARAMVNTDMLERIVAADSVDALTHSIDAVARDLGFAHWIYGALVAVTPTRSEQFVLNGYPDDWREHYLEAGYTFRDPTVHYSRTHVVPTLWDDLARAPGASMRPDALGRRIVREARDFGLAKGLSVPLHGLGCVFGMMSYAAADPNHPITQSSVCAEATLLASYVHQAASALMFGDRMRDIRALTARERECLKWAAEGKT